MGNSRKGNTVLILIIYPDLIYNIRERILGYLPLISYQMIKYCSFLVIFLPILATAQLDSAKLRYATKQGLVLYLGWSDNTAGSTAYQDISLLVFNFAKKEIKYTWATVAAYNPVKDLVAKKTVRGVGPIETNGQGEYNFEAVFRSNVVETIKLVAVKVQYMDGSIREFPESTIPKITLTPQELQTLFEKN